MKKLQWVVLLSLFPLFTFAADGLSFAPPASDYSVVFLGNLFGVVDGVLHGTGSQIMGTMFSVFNSAVLALGGMIIMYTLIVSTMNTAHEGQMLGQKWSSIWIPVRSTVGLALLIPKASGYCMMQIFVMWIVVQGVGAADKIWEAALSYLNRGGVIIQAERTGDSQLKELQKIMPGAPAGIPGAAAEILTGQVCMLGLQKQLETQRQGYLNQKQKDSGPCMSPSADMKGFCDTAVPDFISSVNVVMVQYKNKDARTFSVLMPNLDTPPYNVLNGICGTITWSAIEVSTTAFDPLGKAGVAIDKMSRAIAIQQMYLTLSTIAQIIINNDPQLNPSRGGTGAVPKFSLVARQQFGVPYSKSGDVCNTYEQYCTAWGKFGGTSSTGVLFNGTEFQGALKDYDAIMRPTLALISQAKKGWDVIKSREFIKEANSQGWIMAGAYFFDLVRLQEFTITTGSSTDENTGLDSTHSDPNKLLVAFDPCGKLCLWMNEDKSKMKQVMALIDGSQVMEKNGNPVDSDAVNKPNMTPGTSRTLITDQGSSTVYGFLNNSMMVRSPGQPGQTSTMKFANAITITEDPVVYRFKEQNFPCGSLWGLCLGQLLGDIFYNKIFLFIYNNIMAMLQQLISRIANAFLVVPLTAMTDIFQVGVTTISQPGVNPIVALANMGVNYINFMGNMWMMMLNTTIMAFVFNPFVAAFLLLWMGLQLPIVMCWLGIMVGIGFITAYYVPLLPYIMFTFGAIAWLIAVIEAMVAAPIVALGITHPEGHDAFGKGESAMMILMNVFLRPSMMIIGYIAGIALSYVGVWVLNAGFDHAVGFIQSGADPRADKSPGSGTGDYKGWAGILAFFFSILIYTTTYLIIVQRAFSLIAYLPDKVLRWIGGAPEALGEQAAQWSEELKQKAEKAGEGSSGAIGQTGKQLGGVAGKAMGAINPGVAGATAGEGTTSAKGSDEEPPPATGDATKKAASAAATATTGVPIPPS